MEVATARDVALSSPHLSCSPLRDQLNRELTSFVLRLAQLFFVDVPPTASTSAALEDEEAAGTFISAFPESGDEDEEDDSPPPPPVVKSKNLRQAAWFDPADEQLTVSLKDVSRLRKLRTTAEEDVVSGLDYEGRLRRQ